MDTEKDQGYIKPFHVLTTALDPTDFTGVFSKLRVSFQLDRLLEAGMQPEMMAMYLKENSLKNVSVKDIVGISLWLPKQNGVREHRLYYLNDQSQFVLDPRYSLDCGVVIQTDINYLAANVLKKFESVSWAGYTKNTNINMRVVAQERPKLMEFSRAVVNSADFIIVDKVLSGCFSCGGDEGFNCQFDDKAQLYCASLIPGGCISEKLDNINKSSRLNVKFEISKAKVIRDSITSITARGEQYTKYYYKLSKIASIFDVINSSNVLDHLSLANDLAGVANTIKYGKNSEIVVDEQLKEKAVRMIRQYKRISTNVEFQQILKVIEADLNNLTLENNAEIRRYIE